MAESYSKTVENTVEKGEIARYKAFSPGASKGVIVWEWVKYFSENLISYSSHFKNQSVFQ